MKYDEVVPQLREAHGTEQVRVLAAALVTDQGMAMDRGYRNPVIASVAAAYMLGRADRELSEPNGSVGAICEAALKELGWFA